MINNKNKINDNKNGYLKDNSTSILVPNNILSKSLFDEVNNYLYIMKKGENFEKIRNSKGNTTKILLQLSPDEKYISIIYNGICRCGDEIYVEKIRSCEIGHSNNFYSKNKFENFFTVEEKNNNSHEFYHAEQDKIKSWVNCINYLIQKFKGKYISSTPSYILSKKDISNIWQNEIIPKWTIYRKYLHDKNKQNYFTKKILTNKIKMDKRKDVEENIEILSSNNQEILYLWTLGLPSWLRKNLWNIVIENELAITENLFKGYSQELTNQAGDSNTNININVSKTKIFNSLRTNESSNKNNNNYDSFENSFINSNNNINITNTNINNSNDLIIDLNNDINVCYTKYESVIKSENKINFKKDIYIIVQSFCNYRLDVLYTKTITELASFIYLNSENNYETFKLLCNFIIPSYLFDFIQNDISSIKNYYKFFENLMRKYTPLLSNYFESLNFSLSHVFYRWVKSLFLKIFPYELCLLIFDNFIIKGKIFIFQVALVILIINQKELIHYDIDNLNHFLKKGKFNIEQSTFLEEIDKLDIRDEYEEFFDVYKLGKEKIELFQDL